MPDFDDGEEPDEQANGDRDVPTHTRSILSPAIVVKLHGLSHLVLTSHKIRETLAHFL